METRQCFIQPRQPRLPKHIGLSAALLLCCAACARDKFLLHRTTLDIELSRLQHKTGKRLTLHQRRLQQRHALFHSNNTAYRYMRAYARFIDHDKRATQDIQMTFLIKRIDKRSFALPHSTIHIFQCSNCPCMKIIILINQCIPKSGISDD